MKELEEWRLIAYDSLKTYKERTKAYHDYHIKQGKSFKKGEEVLLQD